MVAMHRHTALSAFRSAAVSYSVSVVRTTTPVILFTSPPMGGF